MTTSVSSQAAYVVEAPSGVLVTGQSAYAPFLPDGSIVTSTSAYVVLMDDTLSYVPPTVPRRDRPMLGSF